MQHTPLSAARDRVLIGGYFEGYPAKEELRAMLLRVLAAKSAGKVADDTMMFVRPFRKWCFQDLSAENELRWKMEAARAWPRADTQGVLNLVDLTLHGTDGSDSPATRDLVERLRAVPTPACSAAASYIQARWKAGQSAIPDVAGQEAPPPLPPIPDGPTVKFNVLAPRPGLIGWLPAGRETSVAWTATTLLLTKSQPTDEFERVATIVASDEGTSVAFDGKYVWAFQNAAEEHALAGAGNRA